MPMVAAGRYGEAMSQSEWGTARARDIDALVNAATALFADRGPAATSLRDVAARAGVNYGLIHQYIGTKQDLLHLVIDRVSVETARRVAGGASVSELVGEVVHPGASLYVRMVARALLDGEDPASLLDHSPAMTALVAQLTRSAPVGTSLDEVAVQAVALMSLLMGWRLFGPFLMSAAGLGDCSVDEVAERLLPLALRVIGQ
jgi:TetR/AcrR family transcriptional regulator, repressor for neighboring sulfatase